MQLKFQSKTTQFILFLHQSMKIKQWLKNMKQMKTI